MDSVLATVSGYHRPEKFNLIKLISQSGASYVGAMNPSITHLVCRKFQGKKYELAKKLKIIVVNHRWIEDCIKQGRRVPERSYTKRCGSEVGPLLLEVPAVAEEVRRPLSEVRNNRNLSEKPVIEIEDGESGDDDWNLSWLLKENVLHDSRQNKHNSTKLKRKSNKRQLMHDDLLTDRYCLDESTSFGLRRTESSHLENQKRKDTSIPESSKGRRRLMHKNIYNDLNSSSDSEEKVDHHHDEGEPSGRQKSTRLYRKRLHVILEDTEETEDLGTCSNLQQHQVSTDELTKSPKKSPEVDDEFNKSKHSPELSTQQPLSCVICWTDFSSVRGVLACGHRFCFSCIQNWADHMASMKKISTCPLCKARFYSIQKMEDALTCDQKIYSQTVPNDNTATDVYILPHGETSPFNTLAPSRPVCYQCGCLEPEELLVTCDRCQIHCVHSYCLDPPQSPWVCIQCKDPRRRFFNFR